MHRRSLCTPHRESDLVPTLEAYDGAGADRSREAESADRAAHRALAAAEWQAKRF